MTDGLEEIGLPPLGHNKPPPDHSELFATADALIATVDRWSAERPAITDAEMAKAAQLLISQQRELRDRLEAAEKAEREPLDLAVAAVRIKFKGPLDRLRVGLERMTELGKAWLQKQRDREEAAQRQRQQEADAALAEAARLKHDATTVDQQLAAEAAEKHAAQLIDRASLEPSRPQVKGDFAKRAMGLRSNWKARVVDPRAALKHYARHETVRQAALAAAMKLASAEARATKGQGEPPPGCEFYNDEGIT